MNPRPEALSPMLCFSYGDLLPSEREAVWKDANNWVAQEKLNGVRMILTFTKGVGVTAHSRTQHWFEDRLLFGGIVPDFTATADCEVKATKLIVTPKGVVARSSLQSTTAILQLKPDMSRLFQKKMGVPLKFHVLDITNWQGMDLRKKPLVERLAYLGDFRIAATMAELSEHFEYPGLRFEGKRKFFNEIIEAGGEGIVFKNLNSIYHDDTSRNRAGWVKCKRQVSFDAFISGFERGRAGTKWANKVACLLFAVNTTEGGEHVIAKIVNVPKHVRNRITVYDEATDTVTLSETAYGRVAVVSGLEIAKRSYRLAHARVLRWRTDLEKEKCLYSLQEIKSGASVPPLRLKY